MTANTWRNDILKVCKYCKQFSDNGKSRNRYQCLRFDCHVYDAHGCKKTFSIREQASKTSREALDNAFFALTGVHR